MTVDISCSISEYYSPKTELTLVVNHSGIGISGGSNGGEGDGSGSGGSGCDNGISGIHGM